jgi:sugar diacid utilization regulator
MTRHLTMEDVVSLQRSLTTTVAKGQSVHGIATVLNATIGGTVVIDDSDGVRLAQAGGDGGEDLVLPDWRQINSAEHARAVRLGEWVLVVARPEGACLGVIGLLDPDGLGDDTDFLALEQGTMVLATEMFRLHSVASNELRVWGDLASDLLDNPDFERSRSHAGGLGYSLDRPHRALVIEPELPGPLPSTEELHRAFRAVGLDGRLSTSRTHSVVCFVADDADWSKLGALVDRQVGGRVRIGVGDRHEPTRLGLSVAEAELALRLSTVPVARFDGLGIARFLSSDADQVRLLSFVDEWIGSLVAYDEEHHSDLVHTLGESLRDQQSLRASSDRLHIHPSTLKYRLRRIQELTGRDLHDADDRFNLDLACRVRAGLTAQGAPIVRAAADGRTGPGEAPDSVARAAAVFAAAKPVVEMAVLDRDGVLTAVNRAWREFSSANGGDAERTGVGASYVTVCATAHGDPWADLIGSVIHLAVDGDLPAPARFTVPCHSPDTSRWFELSVASRYGDNGRCCGATVTLVQTLTH